MWFSAREDASSRSVKSSGAATRMRTCISGRLARLGAAGTRISAWLCRAPGLDLLVSLLTWIPPTVLGILYGWRGVAGAIIGQLLGMLVWMFAHELANRQYVNGPRIVTF